MGRIYDDLNLNDIKIEPGVRFPPDTSAETAVADAVVADLDTEPGPEEESLQDMTLYDAAVAEQPNGTQEQRSFQGDEVLKVSARSRPSAVAGAIAGVMRHYGHAEVQAIGAGATNQALKAVAIARDYLVPDGIDICCIPGFIDVIIAGEERTAIRLVVEPR